MAKLPTGAFKDLQKRIYQNKVSHGFNIIGDHVGINQEICHLAEELGELAAAHRRNDREGVIDGIIDVVVFALGLLEIMGVDGDTAMEGVLIQNEARKYKMNPDGSCIKID